MSAHGDGGGGGGSFSRKLFEKERIFQLRFESRQRSCFANLYWEGILEKWCLTLRGPLTEGFRTNSLDSE